MNFDECIKIVNPETLDELKGEEGFRFCKTDIQKRFNISYKALNNILNYFNYPIDRLKFRKTLEDFIKESVSIHDNKYDYSKVEWKGIKEKVTIICPIHGEFRQKPLYHTGEIKGVGKGCRRCASVSQAENRKSVALTTEQFIDKSMEMHGGRFDYSKAVYKNNNTKVEIRCPDHGWFTIEPKNHYKKNGCFQCAREVTGKSNSKYKNLEGLLKDFYTVHIDKYDYSKITLPEKGWFKIDNKVPIVCKEHGVFYQTISSHRNGMGCNKCRFFGYSKSAFIDYCVKFNRTMVKVYILKFHDSAEEFYKVGITARTIKERFKRDNENMGYKIEKVFVKEFPPEEAWEREKEIKSMFIRYSYVPKKKIPGFSECFNISFPVEEVVHYLKSHLDKP